jgi:uncharacterized membrane protein YjjB (DUF3815 family)
METYIIQLITATVGALGFALIFNVNRRLLIPASLGGFLAWGVYLLAAEWLGLHLLVANVAAGVFCQLYSEVLARILKTPSTVICIPAIIPLIPGGALYRTMYSAVHQNWELCRFYGYQTLLTALGIAAGISFVSAILYILMNRAKQKAIK